MVMIVMMERRRKWWRGDRGSANGLGDGVKGGEC